jgi:hypothetical protein
MKKEIVKTINDIGLKLKKASPDILLVAGIAGTITATVLACKQSRKVDKIIQEKEDTMKTIEEVKNSGNPEYSEQDYKKDVAITYGKMIGDFIRLYGPAVILGTVSITAIISSHHILKKRNIALGAAYVALDKGFKAYRKNVVEEYGDEVDKAMRFGLTSKEVTKTNKNGKTVTKKEKSESLTPEEIERVSEYAKFFDCGNTGWTKDPEANLMFLRHQEQYANDILKTRGHLFLNEVYDMLGIPRTSAGQIVGWIYDEKNPVGDNFVDFGIYRGSESTRRFVNGEERTILLDFNVDGPIYNLL